MGALGGKLAFRTAWRDASPSGEVRGEESVIRLSSAAAWPDVKLYMFLSISHTHPLDQLSRSFRDSLQTIGLNRLRKRRRDDIPGVVDERSHDLSVDF